MKMIAAIERTAIIRQNRSAEPLDWLGALSNAEGLATKPYPWASSPEQPASAFLPIRQ